MTDARLGALTDGVNYRFYSDIDERNKLDQRPYLELNMLEAESIDADELKRFTMPAFDLDKILDTSKDLKYTREILGVLAAEWANPSEALVRHFASQVYDGVKTRAVIEQLETATRKAMHQFLTREDRRPAEVRTSSVRALIGRAAVLSVENAQAAEEAVNRHRNDRRPVARLLRGDGNAGAGHGSRPRHPQGLEVPVLDSVGSFEADYLPSVLQFTSEEARTDRTRVEGARRSRSMT